ncbi:MAG: TOBE domain-containing protein [Planctomycetes bacterium]|nr:TOBE domain-containing protein [Planctomycetota bacterium]
MFFENDKRQSPNKTMEIVSGLLIRKNDHNFLKNSSVGLLEYIDKLGSITKAAKKMNISYKTAWDTLNSINNVSDEPIIVSISGGQGGGGSKLTVKGRKMIEIYRIIEEEQQKFVNNLKIKIDDFDESFQLIKRLFLKTSVRNQFIGKVTHIDQGQVSAKIDLTIQGDDHIVSIISNKSLQDLGIQIGSRVYALIKATYVMISKSPDIAEVNRNILAGKIEHLTSDETKTEIALQLAGGSSLVSIEPNEIADKNKLQIGDEVYAFFKPSSVILGIS